MSDSKGFNKVCYNLAYIKKGLAGPCGTTKKPQYICYQIVEVLFFIKTFSFLYLTIHF